MTFYSAMDLTLSQESYDSSPSSNLSSTDQVSPQLPYYPQSSFPMTPYGYYPNPAGPFNTPSPGMCSNYAYPPPQNDLTRPFSSYQWPFYQQSLLNSRQQPPTQRCLAPSLLLGPSGQSPELIPDCLPATVYASPMSSVDSMLAHTPLLDITALDHAMSPDVIIPTTMRTAPLPVILPNGLHNDVYGYTGKLEVIEAPVSPELLELEASGEGRKRSRTAQACDKCRIRKARVSTFSTHPTGLSFDVKYQCFGGNPCNRCVKRTFKCDFSNPLRQRGPSKPQEGELKPRARRHSVNHPALPSSKRPKVAALSPDIEDDDSVGELHGNQLGLEFTCPSTDLDAEGEDDEGATQWWPSPFGQNEPIYPNTIAAPTAAFGYGTPSSPSASGHLSDWNTSSMMLNYATAAAQVRREAKQQLARAKRGGGADGRTGDDGGWRINHLSPD